MTDERHGFFDNLFDILEYVKSKDQEIACIYGEIGQTEYQGIHGKITSFIPYDRVVINGNAFFFLGERNAIAMLCCTVDGKDYTLYRNDNIKKEYRGYFNDPFRLMQDQEQQLGYSVKAEEMQKGKTHN